MRFCMLMGLLMTTSLLTGCGGTSGKTSIPTGFDPADLLLGPSNEYPENLYKKNKVRSERWFLVENPGGEPEERELSSISTYNEQGQLTWSTNYPLKSIDSTNFYYHYDPDGKLIRSESVGYDRTLKQDKAPNYIETHEYDQKGRLSRKITKSGESFATEMVFEYDDQDRLIRSQIIENGEKGDIEAWRYASNGTISEKLMYTHDDEKGAVMRGRIRFTYNGEGQLTGCTDENFLYEYQSETVSFSYDQSGQLKSLTAKREYMGNKGTEVHTYTYYENGLLKRVDFSSHTKYNLPESDLPIRDESNSSLSYEYEYTYY